MNFNSSISNPSSLEQQKVAIREKLQDLLIEANKLISYNLSFEVRFDDNVKSFSKHVQDLINELNEHLGELANLPQEDLLEEGDIDFFECTISYFDTLKNRYLEDNPTEKSQVEPSLEVTRPLELPIINEDALLRQITESELREPQLETGSLIDPTQLQIATIEANQQKILQKIDALTKDAKNEASKETKMKMRKWRWLAVAQLPASYPYALEAYEFYKPYAIDAYNTTIQMYNTYAPQVLETVSGWFN